MFVGTTKSTVQKYREQVEELKKENAKLKEANDTFTLGARRTIESNCKLYKKNQEQKKQIDKLKEENVTEFLSLLDKMAVMEREIDKLNDKISNITSILTKPSNIGYVQKIKNVLEVIGNDEEVKDGKPTFRQLYENQNMEFEGQKNKISYLEKEIFDMKKISNVKTDLINELFSKIVKKADIDDGIGISKEYGHKYIDEWNKMYEDLIKDTIKVMNEHELDYGLYLEFHDCSNIEFCVMNSDSESEEDGD